MIRRDLLKFGGGAAAGLAFTPIPWRLLGDTAMWSQNWSWMPRVPRGEVADKDARCTLCPAACAVKARCAGGVPIGLWPRESALCPAGFVAHHIAWHPIRLRTCLHRGQPAKNEDALRAASARLSGASGSVAVLDLVPGRTASLLHRHHLAKLGGTYLVPPVVEGATAAATQSLLAQPVALAAVLSDVKTVLSFSTPLLDGWAAPGRVARPNRQFRVIQAEARRSRTAGIADEWLAIRPGSETTLALAIAHCLLKQLSAPAASLDRFAEWTRAAEAMSPALAAQSTGIDPTRIEKLAAELRREPSLVLADGDPVGGPLGNELQSAAAALNVMLGLHGLKARPAIPVPKDWAGVDETPISNAADGSISLLIIDEPTPGQALPWSLIAPKLAHDALVVALTWNQPHFAAQADYLVPVPVFLEAQQDAPAPHDTPQAAFSLSPALLPAPDGVMHASDFVARLAGDEVAFADRLAERIKAIGADPKELEAGGQWIAPAAASTLAARRILPPGMTADRLLAAAQRPAEPLHVVAHGWRASATSPLLGKLWQESALRDAPRSASAHPATMRNLKVVVGRPAVLDTPSGRLPVNLSADENLQEGVLALSSGPAFTQICQSDSSGAWRVPGAKVVPA